MSLSRSSLALQWTIEKLIRDCTTLCGFYLITIPEILNWKEVSKRHKRMLNDMADDVRKKRIKRYAGVRVFEEGEKTNRPHAHWVMCPIMPQAQLQVYADKAGMGHVWLDKRPASPYLGQYLSKYLSKSKGSLQGVRRWAAFGEIDSVKVHDVEVSSPEIDLFRSVMADLKSRGIVGTAAFREATVICNHAKYQTPYDPTRQLHRLPLPLPATKDEDYESRVFMNRELDK